MENQTPISTSSSVMTEATPFPVPAAKPKTEKNTPDNLTRISEEVKDHVPDASKTSSDTHAPVFSKSYRDRFSNFTNKWWLWEYFSLFLSMLALAVIAAVLAKYNGRCLPQWPFGINLNSFISVFSAISKAAMLFPLTAAISQLKWSWFREKRRLEDFQKYEDASREPLGACQLLFATWPIGLVSLGAVIVIAATAIDPFIQQIVAYPYRQVPVGTALMPYAQNYSAFGNNDESPGAGYGAIKALEGAMYTGLLYDNSRPEDLEVIPTCDTGNCTWPSYSSLAFCSECRNITHKLERKHNGTNRARGGHDYKLPNGLVLFYDQYIIVSGAKSKLLVLRDEGHTVGSISLIRRYTSYVNAYECVVSFCVNSYNATVVNGKLKEEKVISWLNRSDPGVGQPWARPSGYSVPGTSSLQNIDSIKASAPGSLSQSQNVGLLQFSSYFYSYPYSVDRGTSRGSSSNRPGVQDYDTKPLWMIPPSSVTQSAFSPLFLVSFAAVDNLNVFTWSLWTGEIYGGPETTTLIASQSILRALYHNDIFKSFDRLAKSMTSSIRQHTDQGGFINGTSWRTETYVHVRWAWISLPVSLLFATLTFVTSTMIKSARSDIPLWKDSTISILRCKLAGKPGEILDSCSTMLEMNQFLKSTTVRLDRSQDGAVFIGETRVASVVEAGEP